MAEPKPPTVPLSSWHARASALEEAHARICHALRAAEKSATPGLLAHQQALHEQLNEIRHQAHVAAARGNRPIDSRAEHLARKCVAAWRAAATAWRRA